jgi:hypothetical protein
MGQRVGESSLGLWVSYEEYSDPTQDMKYRLAGDTIPSRGEF